MADSTRLVQVGGQTYEVPADAGDAHISAALKAIPAANAPNAPKARTWTDVAVDAIPAVLGLAGAAIGGAGGSVLGMGVGGVPGAAGGAAVGTAGGEALKQLINRARGAEAPATAGEAATQIAVPAAIAGATTGVVGGAAKLAAPYTGAILQKVGGALESPSTIRQMVGKGVSAAGRAIDAAPPTAAPKMVLNAADVGKIRQLIAAGVPEAQATKQVWNLKVASIIKSFTP
jgi:hypothetical protein